MNLKQIQTSTVGVMQYPNFENAIWTKNDLGVFTTTKDFQGTLNGDIPVTGTTKFTLTERISLPQASDDVSHPPKKQYSLEVFSTIYKKNTLKKETPETSIARLSVDVLKIHILGRKYSRLQLSPVNSGPGNPFKSTFLSNIGFNIRFEYEEPLKQWVLFIDKGVPLVHSNSV
jgi:hypothetical protein